MQQRLGLTAGLDFYDFRPLGDLTAFKQDYRHRLDTAPWDADGRSRIAGEARIAYRHNTQVLDDLMPQDPRDHDLAVT